MSDIETRYVTAEELDQEISELIEESGHPDLLSLTKAFHDYRDWSAYNILCDINANLFLRGHEQVPTCCVGEDHSYEDGLVRMPGEVGAPPNYKSS